MLPVLISAQAADALASLSVKQGPLGYCSEWAEVLQGDGAGESC